MLKETRNDSELESAYQSDIGRIYTKDEVELMLSNQAKQICKEFEDIFEPETVDCCCGTGKWCDCWKEFKEKWVVK